MFVRRIPCVSSSIPVRRAASPLLLLALLASCTLATEARAPVVLSAAVSTPSQLARILTLELDRPSPVTVEYWSPDGPRLQVTSPDGVRHTVALTRLHADSHYQYQVAETTTTGDFSTDPLPADLAAAIGSATGRQSSPLVLLHLYEPTGFMGYAILDATGQVVWYWRTTDFPFGMTRRANGNFVVMDKKRGLVEVTPAGTVVHELAQDPAREMHHDVIATPANTLLFIAFDDRTVNGATVRGDAIWEWAPETGALDRRWTAWDWFSSTNAPPPPARGEWLHANSLAIGPRGNVLLSAHHWNQILSLAAGWREIEWRLGGVGATDPLMGADAFAGQHTARELAAHQLLLFDNGLNRAGDSRAVEYTLDGGAPRVTWEFHPDPANYATAVGSARRLANGNTLVAFGMSAGLAGSTGPAEVYEVSPVGTVAWHLIVNTQVMFRAEPLSEVGAEVVVQDHEGSATP
jgi:hypothetical protein